MKLYGSRHTGFLISHMDVLPFFIRARLLDQSKQALALETPEVMQALQMPLDEFAQAVVGKTLPEDFQFIEAGNTEDWMLENDGINCEMDFQGIFHLIEELVPQGVKLDEPVSGYSEFTRAEFDGTDRVFTIPLRWQPSLFRDKAHYGSATEIIDEISDAVGDLGVEFPKDFPFWKYIGVLDGAVWDGD